MECRRRRRGVSSTASIRLGELDLWLGLGIGLGKRGMHEGRGRGGALVVVHEDGARDGDHREHEVQVEARAEEGAREQPGEDDRRGGGVALELGLGLGLGLGFGFGFGFGLGLGLP